MERTGVGVLCLWLCAVVCLAQGQDYVNVAQGKSCNQSSKWFEGDSSGWAANGDTDGMYQAGGGNCIHTRDTGDLHPWWEVDLGSTYPVYNITLWARTDFPERLYPCIITVNGSECASLTDTSFPSGTRTATVTCSPVMYGQTVRVTRQAPEELSFGERTLNLCEVQIWVQQCPSGYHRDSGNGSCVPCSNRCQQNSCDREKGVCQECVDGHYTDTCDKVCPTKNCQRCQQGTGVCTECANQSNLLPPDCKDCVNDYYKRPDIPGCEACNGTCKSGTVCDQATGFCLLCPTGRQGHYCEQDCDAGSYGDNCTGQCGHCRITQSVGYCNVTSGHCAHGCQDGWKLTPMCNEACQVGWYGNNCSQQCGSCQDVAACNKTTGHCTCVTGKQPPLCDTDCQDKMYGQGCVQSCGQCRGGQACDPVTGKCSEGCEPGWTDLTPTDTNICQSECIDGFYGEGCKKTCGHCQVNSECRHDTGQCTGQCAAGFTGLYCAEAITESDNTPVIAGAVVAALVAIVILVLIVILVMRRRKNQATKSGSSVTESVELSCNSSDEVGRRQRDIHSTSPLSFDSVATDGKQGEKPKARVKPMVKPKPEETGAIYQNIPRTQQSEQSAAVSNVQGGICSAEPGRSSRTSMEPLTDDEELDSQFNGEAIYANDPSLVPVFKPATIRLDQLHSAILGSLRDDTLAQEFARLTGQKEYAITNGQRQENYYKNRFMSILPYDKTRVVLEKVGGDDASDYINASFIMGYKTEKAYIACQGPKDNTQDDFWRMVWQEGVTDIVMLTNLKEGIKSKCHEYWPEEGKSLKSGQVEVTGVEEVERAHFIIRTFSVHKFQSKDQRQVRQYQYVQWMDHEVPSTTPLVDFWRYVRTRAPRTPTAPPLLVHCSAGVGRTGTYIALDILIDQIQDQKEICLYQTVDKLREDRCYMVQNKDQYVFLHEAVLEAYMSGDCRLQTSSFDHVFPSPIHHDQPHPRIDDEFTRLCQMRTAFTSPSHTVASLEENRHKNRSPHALPDDKHLVYITRHARGRNQYINAVYMPTFLSSRGSIMTQLPLEDTVIDLWRLVDSWNVSTIVSIGQVEGAQDMQPYWPKTKEKPVICGVYRIDLMAMPTIGESLVTYTLDMKKESQSREVRVLHYKAWTGQIADNVSDLLRLLDTLHNSHTASAKEPIIIQCFDGVVQSGAVCALWDVISRMTYDGDVDVYLAARHVHTARPEAITSVVQYRFIYEVVQQYRNSYNVYTNI